MPFHTMRMKKSAYVLFIDNLIGGFNAGYKCLTRGPIRFVSAYVIGFAIYFYNLPEEKWKDIDERSRLEQLRLQERERERTERRIEFERKIAEKLGL